MSIALPPHRREVQRFGMADLRRAYLKDGMRFCRENDFTAETFTRRCSDGVRRPGPSARLRRRQRSTSTTTPINLVFGPYATRSHYPWTTKRGF